VTNGTKSYAHYTIVRWGAIVWKCTSGSYD